VMLDGHVNPPCCGAHTSRCFEILYMSWVQALGI